MRGEEYFDEGAVSELEETSQGEWIASVTGTEDYEVEITIEKDEVTYWFCDCPYDGEICKHVVATMFAIRENNQKANNSMFSRMNIKESEKDMSIEERQDVDTPNHSCCTDQKGYVNSQQTSDSFLYNTVKQLSD